MEGLEFFFALLYFFRIVTESVYEQQKKRFTKKLSSYEWTEWRPM